MTVCTKKSKTVIKGQEGLMYEGCLELPSRPGSNR